MLKITFFITIALSPLYLFKISFFDINTNVFELLMLFSTLLCLLSGSFVFKKIFFKQHWLFFVGIFFLLLGLFISTFNTNYYLVSLGIIKSYFILPIIFSFALFGLLKNKADFENVLFCLFLSIFSISIISLVQKFLGLVSYDGRLAGIFNSPNYLAMFLAPGFFLWFFYFYSEKYVQNKYFKIFLSAALFSISLAFYFTYSYGAWFSVFLSFSLILYLKSDISLKKHFFLSLLLLLMFIFSFFLNSQKIVPLLKNNGRSSLDSRFMIWRASEKIIQDNFYFGIGPGNFQKNYLAYQKYFPPYLEWAVPHPHNLFLAFWLQSGLLGLFGFLLIIFYLLKILLKELKNKKTHSLLPFVLLGYFFYIILHGTSDTTFWKNDLAFVFWFFAFFTIFYKENKLL